jgi:hypothetical protein
MEPATAYLIATAASAVGDVISGISGAGVKRLEAFGVESERKLAQAQATQAAISLRREMKSALKSADALYTAFGREIGHEDRSRAAKRAADYEVVGDDMTDIAMMSRINDIALRQQKAAAIREGKTKLVSSLLQATATAGTGYYQYKRL